MKAFDIEKHLDGLQPDEAIALLQCIEFMHSDEAQKIMRMSDMGFMSMIATMIETFCALHGKDAVKFRKILVETADELDEELGPYTIN